MSGNRPEDAKTSDSTETETGKKLRLIGYGSVKNQETYRFTIDASEISPHVGNYAINIANDNKGKTVTDSETREIEIDKASNRHKSLQSVEIKLREGINTIGVYPRVEGQNFSGLGDKLVVECSNCTEQPSAE